MKSWRLWRLWSLGAVLLLGLACDKGITLPPLRKLPLVEDCGPDQERRANGSCRDKQPVILEPECQADEHCPQGTVCVEEECTPGERDENGNVVPVLSGFQLLINNIRVVPLRNDGETRDNSDPGWVGPIAATLKVTAVGVGANQGLTVATVVAGTPTSVTCSNSGCRDTDTSCEWTCTLPNGWVRAPTTTIDVQVSIGTGKTHKWTYRVSALPIIEFEAPTTATPGNPWEVCVNVTSQAPLLNDGITVSIIEVLASGSGTVLIESGDWEPGELSNGRKCWTTTETLGLTSGSALTLTVLARAVDTRGNIRQELYEEELTCP